jgi:anti-sigma B factor antagonist
MIQFSFETLENQNTIILKLNGSLIESMHGSQMLAKVDEYILNGKNKFVLDMAQFVYMNSSGLSVIINLLTKARKADGDAAICNITKKNNDILIITKLNSVFSVFDTEEEAVNYFN